MKNTLNDLLDAAQALGLVVQIRDVKSYAVSADLTRYPAVHSTVALRRRLKRAMCCSCTHFLRADQRTATKPAWATYQQRVPAGDEEARAEAWEDYRHDQFDFWLEGCKTGNRPDVRGRENLLAWRPGGWWGTVALPCPGYERRGA